MVERDQEDERGDTTERGARGVEGNTDVYTGRGVARGNKGHAQNGSFEPRGWRPLSFGEILHVCTTGNMHSSAAVGQGPRRWPGGCRAASRLPDAA